MTTGKLVKGKLTHTEEIVVNVGVEHQTKTRGERSGQYLEQILKLLFLEKKGTTKTTMSQGRESSYGEVCDCSVRN